MLLPFRADCKSEMASYADALKSLDNKLNNYEVRNLPRPGGGSGNVNVTVDFFIRRISKLDEHNHVKK